MSVGLGQDQPRPPLTGLSFPSDVRDGALERRPKRNFVGFRRKVSVKWCQQLTEFTRPIQRELVIWVSSVCVAEANIY